MRVQTTALVGLTALLPGTLAAQQRQADPPRIDSVHVHADNVFSDSAARRHWIYRMANAVRFQTRPGVVERELLFAAGEPLDTALLDETERNLRALGLFRTVDVDTAMADGRVVAVVHTYDAWSTLPILTGSFASDGTLTGRIGLTERNVLGTGNFLSAAYRKGVDHDGGEFDGLWRRVAGTGVDVDARVALLSDGHSWQWSVSDPWRSLEDGFRLRVSGTSADRRRLQYRTVSAAERDTTEYRRALYGHGVMIGHAVVATPRRVLRLEATAGVRNERHVPWVDGEAPADLPDSVYFDVGVRASFEQPRFRTVGYLDGLNQQDVDLTTGVTLGVRLAAKAFGYRRDGIGPHVQVRGGAHSGRFLVRGALLAGGLFDDAGLDSGRVVVSVTGGRLSGDRQATLLHVQGGLLESPAPGREFDLGFSTPPRSFEPHSFVGTRALWGTFEHRWYALPRILDQFGAALAVYADFGGAWYEDQDARWGGEVGVGLRTSSRLSPAAESNRIDLGYRLGPGIRNRRLVLSVGTGFAFF